MSVDPNELLIFKHRLANNQNQQPPAPAPQRNEAYQPAPAAPTAVEVPPEGIGEGERGQQPELHSTSLGTASQQLTKTELKALARGKKCFWHPWRAAYSLCSECKRPFCYEDIIEYNNQNFCLEDAALGATEHKVNAEFKYGSTLGISGILFLCAFAVFVYFARAQALYLVKYIYSVGLPSFMFAAQSRYLLLLFEIVLIALTLPAAAVILLRSERTYYFSAAVGLATFVLFCYLYLNSGTLYLILIGALSLGAVVVLAFSKGAYASFANVMDYWQPPQQSLKWENAGQF